MRIITANVNGIRSAATKGFFDWFAQQDADVLCLQEIKAMREQIGDPQFYPQGYHALFHSAEAKGYSGVAVYTRREPDQVIDKLGWDLFDREGRYLEVRLGNTSVVSLYLPSGTSGPERQAFKYEVMAWLIERMAEWRATGRDFIVCGDWNIAHTVNDIKNWKSNQKNSGFLPDERAWLDRLFGDAGWVDAWRAFNPDKVEYTWWSNRANAWANNVGWRIDYHVVTPALREAVRGTSIYRGQKFSDHAPLAIDYDV